MAVVSSIVAGVAAVGSAAISSNAAKKASKQVRAGQDAATEEQRRQYDQSRQDFAPWREAGQNALNQLADPTANFYASPDYEFRRSEGLRDTGNMFNMRGGGGNAMKGITGYASNLASGEFNNWFNRTFAQSEAGRGATGTTAHLGANAANNIGGYAMNAANQQANIGMNNAANINNAMNSGISNILYANYLGKK